MEATSLALTIDNVQRDFLYRKGTADEAIIVHALVNKAYAFGPLRRAAEVFELYERMLRVGKSPLIVDAAAYIGAGAVFFALKYPKARLVAVEPEPRDHELLVANTRELPVECLRATVIPYPAPDASAPASGCITIDEIYRRYVPKALPFIVKIDAERQGRSLFAGNLEWVARTPVIIVRLNDCLIPGTPNSQACVDYFTGCNRDFAYHSDGIFSINRELLARRFDS